VIWSSFCAPGACKNEGVKLLKSIWRMPWHEQAMKDVISCDKPRGGASNL
jgi:hypothetical protein